jgi:hypothetical protein
MWPGKPGPRPPGGGETDAMSTVMVPANAAEALRMLECASGFLVGLDAAGMPAEAISECLRGLEQADAVQAAARGQMLIAFDIKGGTWATGSGPPAAGWCTRPG